MDESIINSYLKAGRISVEVKKFAREIIKPGIRLYDIALAIDNKISELGAEPAFPVNLSVDEIAAHFTPDSTCSEVARGLLKVDTGICINGYIADTAISIDLTEDKRHERLIESNIQALHEVCKKVKPNIKIKEIGITVEEKINELNKKNKTNFSIVRGLCGHTLGKNIIHAGLTIPNYKNNSEKELNETAFAVEPFLTCGNGTIYEGKGGGIYALKTAKAKVRDRNARNIIEFIEKNYKTRPFCIRWLEKEGFEKIRFALSILEKSGIVMQYGLLIEKDKMPVSQFEHTFLIANKKVWITTKE